MKRRINLTPGFLSIAFGVLLLLLAGGAGFYVPAGYSSSSVPSTTVIDKVNAPSSAPIVTPALSLATPANAGLASKSSPQPTDPAASPTTSSTSVTRPANATTAPAAIIGTATVTISQPTGTPLTTPTATAESQPTSQPTVAPVATATPDALIYIVKSGDTLSEIANKFNVSADVIIRYNGLSKPDALSEGDRLAIPRSSPTAQSATDVPQPTQAPAATATPNVLIYIVKSGDTISDIAGKFNVSAESIIKYNGLSKPDALSEGDKLAIPQ